MKTATKSQKNTTATKLHVATEVTMPKAPKFNSEKDQLPKKLPIGVHEVGVLEVTTPKGIKGVYVTKSKKAFTMRLNNGKNIRFDLRTGKSKDEEVYANPKSFKRDDAKTMKALEAHRVMKLEAQQRYLSKQK
jgi:hypothetical protein